MNIQKKIELKEKEIQAGLGLLKLSKLNIRRDFVDISRKSSFQKAALKKIFNLTKYPTKQTRDDLALFLSLSSKSIQIWFQNERKMSRRKNETEDESWRILVNINVITLYNIIFDKSYLYK